MPINAEDELQAITGTNAAAITAANASLTTAKDALVTAAATDPDLATLQASVTAQVAVLTTQIAAIATQLTDIAATQTAMNAYPYEDRGPEPPPFDVRDRDTRLRQRLR